MEGENGKQNCVIGNLNMFRIKGGFRVLANIETRSKISFECDSNKVTVRFDIPDGQSDMLVLILPFPARRDGIRHSFQYGLLEIIIQK